MQVEPAEAGKLCPHAIAAAIGALGRLAVARAAKPRRKITAESSIWAAVEVIVGFGAGWVTGVSFASYGPKGVFVAFLVGGSWKVVLTSGPPVGRFLLKIVKKALEDDEDGGGGGDGDGDG